MTATMSDSNYSDRIDMRLHQVERSYNDPRADVMLAVALDGELPISMRTRQKMLREAEAIHRRARAFAPRPGSINVRASVIGLLRRLGG